MSKSKKKSTLLANIAFLVMSAAILTFLLKAPEKTTTSLPHNDDHNRFFGMKKKAAGKLCVECHAPDAIVPLPADHPPKYRCLFCHRRD
jgi:cytochrome c553